MTRKSKTVQTASPGGDHWLCTSSAGGEAREGEGFDAKDGTLWLVAKIPAQVGFVKSGFVTKMFPKSQFIFFLKWNRVSGTPAVD